MNEECPATDVGLKTLRRCSTTESLSCIPTSLFCKMVLHCKVQDKHIYFICGDLLGDSKIDCGGFLDSFGLDEQQCYFPYLYAVVAVLVILIVIILIYGFIHWVRVKTKSWSENAETRYTEEGEGGGDAAMSAAVDMDASMGAF